MTTAQALALLYVQAPSFAGCSTLADHQAVLHQWQKGSLRNAYRAQVRAHHPDRGDPALHDQRTAHMKQVNAAHEHLVSLRIERRQPTMVNVRVGTHRAGTQGGTPTTTNTVHTRWVQHPTG